MNHIYICRSLSTGKYHKTYDSNITNCNYSGQNRASRNRKATPEEIAAADSSMFCKKCFPNGKPAAPKNTSEEIAFLICADYDAIKNASEAFNQKKGE